MSKVVEWNPEFGTGGILKCSCDNCKKTYGMKFKTKPSYKEASQKMKEKHGWFSKKIGENWYDLCSDKCRDELIAKLEADK